MPSRIITYLDNMDELREQIGTGVDEQLKRIKVSPLLGEQKNTAKAFKSIIRDFMFSKETRQLIAKARLEGVRLAKTL